MVETGNSVLLFTADHITPQEHCFMQRVSLTALWWTIHAHVDPTGMRLIWQAISRPAASASEPTTSVSLPTQRP